MSKGHATGKAVLVKAYDPDGAEWVFVKRVVGF